MLNLHLRHILQAIQQLCIGVLFHQILYLKVCTAVSATDAAPPLGNNVPGTGWPGLYCDTTVIEGKYFVPVLTSFTIYLGSLQNVTVTKTVSVARGNIPEAGIVFTNTDVVPNGSGGFTTN